MLVVPRLRFLDSQRGKARNQMLLLQAVRCPRQHTHLHLHQGSSNRVP
jgi:hypothetical protein